ncbi:AI-2E family transporter [Candidatus Uhrbacteria bacterium]|jgi:predicted PurR-regulated permease PerM|nr:AI-2E family transporter [Candidatus Uhrbacteria bacterium]MBT7717483.1 AI-2E family transporter [Candidatus Uhrbacteria bacterium]
MTQHNKASKEVQISISSTTVLKVVGILAVIVLLYFLRDIVALVLVALLIAVSIDPIVDFLVQRKVPRALAAGLTFLTFIIVVTGVLLLVIPNVIAETGDLIESYSWLIEDLTGGAIPLESWFQGDYVVQDAGAVVDTIRHSGVSEALPAIASFASAMFGGFLSIILVLALSFYIVIEEGSLRSGISLFLPKKQKQAFEAMLPTVRKKIGSWLRGQLLLMLIMFTVTYTILMLLDVPFALVLALIAGLMDIIPFIGAILVFFPIVLVALSASPVQAVLVAIALLINQQIHGDIITPKIMQKAAGMNPVVTIIAILVGFEIAGVAGAILAIPSAMLVGVFIHEWLLHKK